MQRIQVAAHAWPVDDETLNHVEGAGHGRACQQTRFGYGGPLGVHRRPVALVLRGAHGLQHGGHQRPRQPGLRHDRLALHGVALVGHGAGADLAHPERFLQLRHLALLQHDDFVGDLAHGGGDHSQQRHQLGQAIARRVPGDVRHAQPQLLHQPLLHCQVPRCRAKPACPTRRQTHPPAGAARTLLAWPRGASPRPTTPRP